VLWKYVRNIQIYRCPFDVEPYQDTTHKLTSYCMNIGTMTPSGLPVAYKINKFKGDDILFWEADERQAIWNDGTNFLREGITARHGARDKRTGAANDVSSSAGAIVGCMGGHAEWITVKYFNQLGGYAQPTIPKPNRLACGPQGATLQ
jgi:hypothetical protein